MRDPVSKDQGQAKKMTQVINALAPNIDHMEGENQLLQIVLCIPWHVHVCTHSNTHPDK